jgi:hypothetical protein
LDTESLEWEIRFRPDLTHYTIEWAEEGDFLLSRGNRIYRAEHLGAPLVTVGEFPAPSWRTNVARFRVAQRLLRFLFYNVLKLPDQRLFATFDTRIGCFSQGGFEAVRGLRRPCRVLRGACAADADGTVYFGEYRSNSERDAVHIYRYASGSDEVEVVYRFNPGEVRHVHGIYYDPYSKALWCLTGDRSHECRVAVSHDHFRTLDVVGEGDETWRCVSALFTNDAIYYGSDGEFERNQLYRIDRATGRRDAIGLLDGPVYYSCAVGSDLFFAVTAELCPSQVGRSATLWHVSEGQGLARVLSFEKDFLPVRFFLPGTLHFPRGPGLSNCLWIHGLGLKGADNRTFAVTRKAPSDPALKTENR